MPEQVDDPQGLPGPVYDALPDGWGMRLMDRLFKRRGLHPARIGPLELSLSRSASWRPIAARPRFFLAKWFTVADNCALAPQRPIRAFRPGFFFEETHDEHH